MMWWKLNQLVQPTADLVLTAVLCTFINLGRLLKIVKWVSNLILWKKYRICCIWYDLILRQITGRIIWRRIRSYHIQQQNYKTTNSILLPQYQVRHPFYYLQQPTKVNKTAQYSSQHKISCRLYQLIQISSHHYDDPTFLYQNGHHLTQLLLLHLNLKQHNTVEFNVGPRTYPQIHITTPHQWGYASREILCYIFTDQHHSTVKSYI
jgi:hypothetical protein